MVGIAPDNIKLDILPMLAIVNQGFDSPLPLDEVQGIARSVERYRDRWKEHGRFYSIEEREAWGRGLARLSTQARRKRKASRDGQIVHGVMSGRSMVGLAREHGIAVNTVRHVMLRDAPLWSDKRTLPTPVG